VRGTADGAAFKLEIDSDSGTYVVKGQVDGDKIGGTWSLGTAEGTWEGTRQPKPAKLMRATTGRPAGDAAVRPGRLDDRVHHRLHANPVPERGAAGTALADGRDELEGLVVAEALEGIAGRGIARRARDLQELGGDLRRLEQRPGRPICSRWGSPSR